MIRSLENATSAILSPSRLAAHIYGIVKVWHQRSVQRAQLRSMDDVTLRDLGLTRSDAIREGEKLFWHR